MQTTNNMIKLKWPEYSCLHICNVMPKLLIEFVIGWSRSLNRNQMNPATIQGLNNVAQDDE
jgi:hypothetical protein